jgi:hypothetical protein
MLRRSLVVRARSSASYLSCPAPMFLDRYFHNLQAVKPTKLSEILGKHVRISNRKQNPTFIPSGYAKWMQLAHLRLQTSCGCFCVSLSLATFATPLRKISAMSTHSVLEVCALGGASLRWY